MFFFFFGGGVELYSPEKLQETHWFLGFLQSHEYEPRQKSYKTTKMQRMACMGSKKKHLYDNMCFL